MAYMDNSGLLRKFGTEKTVATKGGEYRTVGQLREIEFRIDLTTLTEAETILSDVQFMPKMRIAEVKVVTHTAAVTGTAIDLGLIATDRTTEIDYNGLLAAFVTATMNVVGETTILTAGSATVGALVGTTTSNVGYFTCSRTDATAFTAGVIYVTVKYYAA